MISFLIHFKFFKGSNSHTFVFIVPSFTADSLVISRLRIAVFLPSLFVFCVHLIDIFQNALLAKNALFKTETDPETRQLFFQ